MFSVIRKALRDFAVFLAKLPDLLRIIYTLNAIFADRRFEEKYSYSINILYNQNKRKWKPGEKAIIHFLFHTPWFWSSWDSLARACLEDGRVEVKFIIADEPENRELYTGQTDADFMRERGLPHTRIKGYNPALERPHIMVYQVPYAYPQIARYLDVRRVKTLGVRPVYVSYGIEFDKSIHNDRLQNAHYKRPLHSLSWRLYVMHDDIRENFARHCPVNAYHVRALGHPKFDQYAANRLPPPLPPDILEKAAGRSILLYQVHYPSGADNLRGKFHTLPPRRTREIVKYLQSLAGIFTVVTLHPRFFEYAKKAKLLDEREFLAFKELISGHANSCLYVGDHQVLVANADAFITEYSSLMLEMGYFQKPVLFLANPDYPPPLEDFAEKLAGTFHRGSTVREVGEFIARVRDGDR
ncbi:MAG: hypothetical protein LBU23_09890, partial [Planctomycetota bacterium]|nr:hypothetical protein [Planctomycetota bacterium]